MLIYWSGSRIKRQAFGHIAEYCPICHRYRKFRVLELRKTDHVYSITVGSGDTVGHLAECSDCGFSVPADIRRYRSLRGAANRNVEELVRQTNPGAEAKLAESEALAEQIRAGTVSAEIKAQLLSKAIDAADALVRQHLSTLQGSGIDIVTFFCALTTFIGSLGLMIASDFAGWGRPAKLAAGAVFAVGSALSLFLFLTARGRLVRRAVLPGVARAIANLNPGQKELEVEFARAAKFGNALVAHVSPSDLRSRMNSGRSSP